MSEQIIYDKDRFANGVNIKQLADELAGAGTKILIESIEELVSAVMFTFPGPVSIGDMALINKVIQDHVGGVVPILNKYDATAAPTVNEDVSIGYQVGSKIIDITADRSYLCMDATDAAAVWKETTQPLFEYSESEGVTSNSTTSYIEKLKHTTASLLAGDYLIEYCGEVGTPDGAQDCLVKIEVDDTTIIGEWDADANGTFWNGFSGFKKINLSASTHTIDIDFKSSSTDQVDIRRARIRIRKL